MLARTHPTTETMTPTLEGPQVEPTSDTIVEVRALRKVYGTKVAVDDVSFGAATQPSRVAKSFGRVAGSAVRARRRPLPRWRIR
jgi:hypothetical protein